MKTEIRVPKKNCFNCQYIENIGENDDLWKCNKGIFDELKKGVDFLICPLWKKDI